MTMIYAQIADLDAYMGASDYLPDNPHKQALIEQCQRDLDLWAGYARGHTDNPPDYTAFDPTNTGLQPGDRLFLQPWQITGLNRATCAQAEYRLAEGPEFFMQPPGLVTEGPDYTISGFRPRLAPKALYELRRIGLMQVFARAKA